jgi:hypothetical protein
LGIQITTSILPILLEKSPDNNAGFEKDIIARKLIEISAKI